jgi:hypothetical protein
MRGLIMNKLNVLKLLVITIVLNLNVNCIAADISNKQVQRDFAKFAKNKSIQYDNFKLYDLNNDGNKEIIIVEGGDGKYVDIILAVYKYDNGSITLIDKKTIGFSVGLEVNGVSFTNNKITVKGKKHLEGDAMCCPSGNITIKYLLVNDKIIDTK